MKQMSNEEYQLLQHSQLIFHICNVLYQELSHDYNYPRIIVQLLPYIGWEIRVSIGDKSDDTLRWVNEIYNIDTLNWLSTHGYYVNDLVRYVLDKFNALTNTPQ
jgi:hypothetical protein